MERIPLKDLNWTDGAFFAVSVMTKLAGGAAALDFTGLESVKRSEVEPVLLSLKMFAWSEETLRERLGVSTMHPNVQRVILPIFDLKPPQRDAPSEFSNNPFNQLDEIQNTYKAYVDTFVNVKSDPIREWLESKVSSDNLLWNEPFLQVRRRYKVGTALDALISQGLLPAEASSIFRIDAENVSDPRPIHPHQHQSRALTLAHEGKNFIVATGTGSGKSFAFGLPIIAHALRSKGKPGIKAVILYPMNALANSQYQDFALRLHGSGLKIALYTGDTKYSRQEGQLEKEHMAELEFSSDAAMWSREEIRDTPPDILMTNYAQLELLLTRGEDRQLFPEAHKGALRYLVLDEVHTYAGKRGAEVACLIRRLKQHTGTTLSLQVIGTSATVESGEGEDAEAAVKRFASNLFGQDVHEVVTESYVEGGGVSDSFLPQATPAPAEVEAFNGSDEAVLVLAEKILMRPLGENERTPNALGKLFMDYAPLHFIERALYEEPLPFAELARRYIDTYRPGFSEAQAITELKAAIFIGQYAHVEREGSLEPRIVLKLHSFYSQGLGVSGTLTNPPTLSIRGEAQLKTQSGPSAPAFPLVFCRVCGQEYYIATLKGNAFLPTASLSQQTGDSYYVRPGLWDPDSEPLPEDWLTEKTLKVKSQFEAHLPLNVRIEPHRAEQVSAGLPFTLLKAPFLFCPSCQTSYDRRPSEIGKLIPYGMVGRSTASDIVISRTLDVLPIGQRKLIAFVDNRQDTEFQAAHFKDLSRKVAFRQTVVEVLKHQLDGTTELSSLGTEVWNAWKREDSRKEAGELYDANSQVGQAYQRLLKGFAVADASRSQQPNILNLEEAGVVRYDYKFLDDLINGEDFWKGLPDSDSEGVRQDYLRGFLDLMRRRDSSYDEAIFDSGVYRFKIEQELDSQVRGERFWEPTRPTLFTLQSGQPDPKFAKASALTASKRRTKFEAWTMSVFGIDREQAQERIKELVKRLQGAKVLRALELKSYGYNAVTRGYVINPGAVKVTLITAKSVRVCPRSRMVSRNGVIGRSPEFPQLTLQTRSTANYFHKQYSDVIRLDLSDAMAHSGQVEGDKRREIETRFKNKDDKLNVLVATPTMEMGIDIGALSAVYMRNVPPNPANYAQRSGRAGRKGQSALVQVFCGGGAARGPHDQYFYRYPERMISGRVVAPRFLLNNERLIASHIRALTLEILTQRSHVELPRTVPDLVSIENDTGSYPLYPDLKRRLEEALAGQRSTIVEAVKEAFAKEMEAFEWLSLAFIGKTVDGFVTDLDAILSEWRDEYKLAKGEYDLLTMRLRHLPENHHDYRDIKTEHEQAFSHIEFLRGKGKSGLDLRRYLGGQGFLPNYAFPRRAARVEFRTEAFDQLERPPLIALSEIAPGNSLYYKGQRFEVARASISQSGFGERHAKRCPSCRRVTLLQQGASLDVCPACGENLSLIAASIEAITLPVMQAEPKARITSDAEERQRRGFEISSHYLPRRTNTQQAPLENGMVTLSYEHNSDAEERQRRGFEISSHYLPRRTNTQQAPLENGMVTLSYEHNGTVTTVNVGPRTLSSNDERLLDGFAFCTSCKRWLFSDSMINDHVQEGGKNCPQGATMAEVKRNLTLFVEQQSDVITLDILHQLGRLTTLPDS